MQQFWSHVEDVSFLSTEDCWLWKGSRASGRYGKLKIRGITYLAHRISAYLYCKISWAELRNGNTLILHSCDSKCCINPSHLRCGTHTENMIDMKSRSRQATGSRHGMSKLTELDIVKMRELDKTTPRVVIARQFSVSKALVSYILNGRNWRHI